MASSRHAWQNGVLFHLCCLYRFGISTPSWKSAGNGMCTHIRTAWPVLHRIHVFSSLQCNELNQFCRGMFDSTILGCFSFVKPYHKLQGIEFLQDMFNSHAVQRLLQVCPQYRQTDFCFLYMAHKHQLDLWQESCSSQEKFAAKNHTASFGLVTQGPHIITFEPVPATVTSMSLFDRLTEQGIARKDGMITKCMEDYIDGFQVCQGLRLYASTVHAFADTSAIIYAADLAHSTSIAAQCRALRALCKVLRKTVPIAKDGSHCKHCSTWVSCRCQTNSETCC